MNCANRWELIAQELAKPPPVEPLFVAASAESLVPRPGQLILEAGKVPQVPRHPVIVAVPVDDTGEPLDVLRYRSVHPTSKLPAKFPQFPVDPRPNATASNGESPLAASSAVVGETEEVERCWLTQPLLAVLLLSKAAESDQSGLMLVHFQSELLKAPYQFLAEP